METTPGKCGVCGKEFLDKAVLECPTCATPHHEECWGYNGGCAIYGCNEKTKVPALHDTTPPSTQNPPAPPELSSDEVNTTILLLALLSCPPVFYFAEKWGWVFNEINGLTAFLKALIAVVSLLGTLAIGLAISFFVALGTFAGIHSSLSYVIRYTHRTIWNWSNRKRLK